MFQLLLCQRHQLSSCSRVKKCGNESSSCRHKHSQASDHRSCEHHDVGDWVIQIYVGWLLRYSGLQNTWYKMIFGLLTFWISADTSSHFCSCWAVSLHVCAWWMHRAEQFGYCAGRNSEMARNERNEEKSLQWNSENCFPLFFWPSWAATCTCESRKAPLWSLSRREAVFLGGLFPGL